MYTIQISQKFLLIPTQFHPGATLVNLIGICPDLVAGCLTQIESHCTYFSMFYNAFFM